VQPRSVQRSVFQIGFPEENRASFAVDVPAFTYSNRWPPDENRDLRNQYEQVLSAVAETTPGNVLVFMPSYQEAYWAGEILDKEIAISKPVLIDESSSNAATERLKEEFFEGGPKILTTGLRGTLTEGVDFAGDKLHAVVVCGVPITFTGSELADAIEAAYGYRFGGHNGFDYAFAVPAVRKTRQAIGRVIRGADDVGVRVVADERYTSMDGYTDVRQHFPSHVRDEFTPTDPDALRSKLSRFWTTNSP
jgi:DNA excision repair protein ERCC-2